MQPFEEKITAMYGQVGLWDNEDPNAYPKHQGGDRFYALGKKGIAVLTDSDKEIKVVVTDDESSTGDLELLITAKIEVGLEGISFGNIPAAQEIKIDLMTGEYEVAAYTDNENPLEVTKVIFLVKT